MSNATDLLVRLLVDDTDLDKVDGAGSKFSDFGSRLDKASAGAAVVLGGLAAGAVAAGNAAVGAANSQSQLQFALDQFPNTADTTAAKLGEINAAIARKTGIDDDSIAVGQAVLAQYGLTGAQLEQMTPLLVDYAAKTGQDMPAAAEALGKGLMGQGRALKAVGIDMEDAGSVAGNYDQIMAGLTTQVSGYADAMGETAEGKQRIFMDQLGELQESLGTILLPIIEEVSGSLADFAGWAADNADTVATLAGVVGGLAGAVLLANGAYKGMLAIQGVVAMVGLMRGATVAGTAATTANTAATWANNAAWLASPVTWIILAIIVAVGLLVAAGIWLVQNWDGVVKWFGDAWQWIMDLFGGFASWWNETWSGVGAVFETVFGGIASFVKDGVINPILSGVEAMVNGVIFLLNGMINGINAVIGWTGIQIGTFGYVHVPMLAEGGIATRATLAYIGEAGPEAVIPLSEGGRYGLGSAGGNDSPTHVTLQLDGRTFYEAMVRAERKRR